MSIRPSSSGGPSSNNSANSFKYDKRVSRDDSYINHRAAAGAGFKPYGFARGQLPTPESSPRESPPRKISIPTVRMPTPESLNEVHSSEIGMALGSPTTTPASSRTPQPNLKAWQGSTTSLVSTIDSPDKSSLRRKQSGRWRLFGMFGRKGSDHSPSKSIEQKQPPLPEQPVDVASQARYDSRVERSNTVSTRGAPRQKPTVSRSQTMPYNGDSTAQASRLTLREKERSKDTHGRIPIALDNRLAPAPVPAPAPALAPAPAPCGSLLDVEIPQITMERYSVMFGSVLQPQPSLLARRQANVQKLKDTDDASKNDKGKKLDILRRESSPADISPSLALFPPPPSEKPTQTTHTASPRLRSNTSPAQLRSPSQANFDHNISHRKKPSHEEPSTQHRQGPSAGRRYQQEKLTIATLARAREQQAAAKGHKFSAETSSLVLESPVGVSSPEPEVVKSEPLRPKASYMQEPKWQMITPPNHTPSTASSSSTANKKPRPSSPASSAHSDLSQTSQDDDDDDDVLDSATMNPVELSIARQISISRQQRKMLKPLHTVSARRQPPVPKITIAQNERIAETKTATRP